MEKLNECINVLDELYDSELAMDARAELATILAENERFRMLIKRAKIIIEDHNWVWHEDADEALK